ncbi:polyhydroxyalkanoic acid system family protein [Sphingomonas sp. DBB INV C78]|uniref:polyhydroxyalkanoic acid system family protein n=1 Tax=Sphingomonas sp. DBB INV C78 TaxID=3349434 RepID=UPI0036D35352
MLGRLMDMAQPIIVDIPHKVGRAEARRRLDKGLGQLTAFVPGGTIVSRQWDGDKLTFVLEALGQRLTSCLEVFDDKVHAIIDLPPILALAAAKVQAGLVERGKKLLR